MSWLRPRRSIAGNLGTRQWQTRNRRFQQLQLRNEYTTNDKLVYYKPQACFHDFQLVSVTEWLHKLVHYKPQACFQDFQLVNVTEWLEVQAKLDFGAGGMCFGVLQVYWGGGLTPQWGPEKFPSRETGFCRTGKFNCFNSRSLLWPIRTIPVIRLFTKETEPHPPMINRPTRLAYQQIRIRS
jgi:hypothetical protein